MAILNNAFTPNPYDYAKRFPLAVVDRALTMMAPAAKGPNASGSGYRKVPKADRVSYCQINSQGGGGNSAVDANTGGRAAIIVDNPPVTAAVGDWFPVYYLPWSGNSTFRMTLKQNGAAGLDPDIFFTSALNGCSVFVEGTPQNPTVYHLNDAASGGGPSPTGQSAAVNTTYWDPLKNNMEGRFAAATSPKSILNTPVGQAVVPAKAVHAMTYMDVTEHYYAGCILPSVIKQNKIELAELSRKPGEDVESVVSAGNIYQPYGTVFGWKQGGLWTFYYQKRGFIAYAYKKTYSKKSKYRPRETETFYVKRHVRYSCDEFWPNGSGVAVAKAPQALV